MSAVSSKEQKRILVSIAILEIIDKDGLSGVTHSKVARKSKVSRAWIYEYIGKEKTALIESAAEVLASYFTRIEARERPKTKAEIEFQLQDGIEFLFDSAETMPALATLYFRFRGTVNPLGEVIQKYEKRWLTNVSETLTQVLGIAKSQALLMAELNLTLRMGFAHRLVTSRNRVEARAHAEEIFTSIHALLSVFWGNPK